MLSDDEISERLRRAEALVNVECRLCVLTLAAAMEQASHAMQSLTTALEVADLTHQMKTGRPLFRTDE